MMEVDMKGAQLKHLVVIGIAGAVAFGTAAPSFGAPVLSNTAAVKMAAPDLLDPVHYRYGRGYGAGIALGIIGAAAAGAIVARQYHYGAGYYGPGPAYYYGPEYYGPSPYYGDYGPYYGPSYYGPPPGYYGPRPGYYGPGYYAPGYDPGRVE
jgi:hypothetical protein